MKPLSDDELWVTGAQALSPTGFGVGRRIGSYVIEAVAGRGGMGLVYRARQRQPERIVAIKVISPEYAANPEFRNRFERESAIAAQIEHPNVIPVYEVGEDGELLYIAMRFVEGVDLGDMLAHNGRLEPRRAARLVAQVADALDAAHARGLVHRDVKPGNVLVAANDHVYLTDFGITKRTADAAGLTKTGVFVGTLDYVAPEQIEGRVDGRADVYALGCMTYQLLSGGVPFPRGSEIAKIFAHLNDPPPRLADVPAPLADAVQRAMAKSPGDRFLSAGEFGRAVMAGAAGRSEPIAGRAVATGAVAIGRERTRGEPGAIAATVPSFDREDGAPARRTRTWALGGVGATLIAAIAAGVVLALGGGGPRTMGWDGTGSGATARPTTQNYSVGELTRFLLRSSDLPSGYPQQQSVSGSAKEAVATAKTRQQAAGFQQLAADGLEVFAGVAYQKTAGGSVNRPGSVAFAFGDPEEASRALPVLRKAIVNSLFATGSASGAESNISASGLGDESLPGVRLALGPNAFYVYVWRDRNVDAEVSGSDFLGDMSGQSILMIAQEIDFRATH